MSHIRRVGSFRQKKWFAAAGVLSVAGCFALPAQAIEFGHSRLVSKAGQPLQIVVPVTQLSPHEADSLKVVPAPEQEWQQAGLKPPVPLTDMHAELDEGSLEDTHVIRVTSQQVFDQPIADLMLDVHTSSGAKRYQVSLLSQGASGTPRTASSSAPSGAGHSDGQDAAATQSSDSIQVRAGDTMSAIAQRHAVSGVSLYQMMMALQRANPQAFIQGNVNLVKAGSTLSMPDSDALTALSDREARRLFHEHLVAFEQGRAPKDQQTQSQPAVVAPPEPDTVDETPQPSTSQEEQSSKTMQEDAEQPSGDELKLSRAAPAGSPDTAIQDGPDTVSETFNGVGPGTDASSQTAGQPGELQKQTIAANQGSVASAPAGADDTSGGDTTSQGTESSQDRAAAQDDIDDDGATEDDRVARGKAIEDAKQRVSQLEENVRNLNEALQSQGEAAKDIVIDGAQELRQSLNDVATAVSEATQRGEQEAPTDDSEEPVADRADDVATPASTSGGTDQPASSDRAENSSATTPVVQEQTLGGWVWEHVYAILAASVGLLIIIVAWMLWYTSRRQATRHDAVTPEMVQEKLDQINLDLDEPVVGDTTRPS